MRALKAMLASLLVALVAVVVVQPQPAKAADGAVVTRSPEGCFVFGIPMRLQDVQTPSGNEKFSCHGEIAPGLVPHALVLHDVPCSGFSGTGTGDVRITPSGEVNATCQIRS